MSNDSNRDSHTISPGELQASDFFPPGSGWNKEASEPEELKRKAAQYERDCQDDESASDGRRPH